ncbi:KGGVGR-motif variant AAA ATPase [Amycolatopsis sp. YIM 10]|uniref:KGGVGR-motif variant AAA ATPase n=1 Tax=Amycolatopsis sp. YIM 10 TaxID=2653857 RepID=UPI00129074BA|nr:AAA family ATPase [Amycolatopsis sp. YIM 10]QFU87535.1 CobQ/CobB/MinD/ParA nucleotide binding domain protein [Amycolatopsis sp. YIM 10]
MPGTVVTLYSFKGGVGRSFTLANIAVLLARWGHRVLCVDWDLEAPGLPDYFRPLLREEPAGGVIDLVDDFLADTIRPGSHVTPLTAEGTLDFIAAGRDDVDYAPRLQAIDWESLYEQGFGDYLEQCRERWTADYDYVLLDSRTGISDIGGICTAHLPDQLVVLYTANMQSLRGALDIAQRANAARDRLPFDRPRLPVLPVLSRFDTREEYDRSEKWRETAVQLTEGLFSDWLHRAVPPEVMSRHLTLPYVSYWSFGEQLPVLFESSPGADQIGFALETLAAVIAHQLDRTDLLAENRDAYVASARTVQRDFLYDLRISTQRSTLDVAKELVGELELRGLSVGKSMSGDRSLLTKRDDDARHLCLIVDRKVSRWQEAEVELFLHRTLGQNRRLIPVLTEDAEPNALPGYLGNLRYLRLGRSRGPAEVARDLAGQLNGHTSLVDTGEVDLASVLRQVAQAQLRPVLWELVDEVVQDLVVAIGDGDAVRAKELAADLTMVIRPRAFTRDGGFRTASAATTREIAFALRVLEARAVDGRRD